MAHYSVAHLVSGIAPHHLDRVGLLGAVVGAAAGSHDEQRREFGLPASHEVPADDIVMALQQLPDLRNRLDVHERHLMEAARDCGESWAPPATRLGQDYEHTMQQRYRHLGGTRTW